MSKERLLATGLDDGRALSSVIFCNYQCLKAIEIENTNCAFGPSFKFIAMLCSFGKCSLSRDLGKISRIIDYKR